MLSASSLLAGCGGHARHTAEPHLPRSDAAQLITLAQAVSRDAPVDACAAQQDAATLAAKARELVAAGRVPLSLRAHLLAGVDAVAADAPACAPPPKSHGKEKHHKEKHHGHD